MSTSAAATATGHAATAAATAAFYCDRWACARAQTCRSDPASIRYAQRASTCRGRTTRCSTSGPPLLPAAPAWSEGRSTLSRLPLPHSFHKACGESAFVPVNVRPFSTCTLDLTILEWTSKKAGHSRTGTSPSRPPKVPAPKRYSSGGVNFDMRTTMIGGILVRHNLVLSVRTIEPVALSRRPYLPSINPLSIYIHILYTVCSTRPTTWSHYYSIIYTGTSTKYSKLNI